MVITRLQATKRGNRINIYTDRKYAFTISVRLLSRFALYQGKELSENEIEKIKKKAFTDLYYDRVVNLLSRRPRSENEIRTYLIRKLKSKRDKNTHIDILITLLKKKEFIDDKKFARWWVRNRISFKPRGSYLITKELLGKGIDKDCIKSALQDESFKEKELALALRVGEKKARQVGDLANIKNIKRFMAFLQRKGFSYEIANRALKRFQQKNI